MAIIFEHCKTRTNENNQSNTSIFCLAKHNSLNNNIHHYHKWKKKIKLSPLLLGKHNICNLLCYYITADQITLNNGLSYEGQFYQIQKDRIALQCNVWWHVEYTACVMPFKSLIALPTFLLALFPK